LQFENLDEAKITDAISGRTVEYVQRDADGGVSLVCRDGRVVELFVDSNQDIQLRGFGVRIQVFNPGNLLNQ
jgi:hypothetical protein